MSNTSTRTNENLIELFILDTTAWPGGSLHRVCNSRISKDVLLSTATVTFAGNIYICLPFDTADWHRGGDRPSRPEVIIPDGNMDFYEQLEALGGAPGARVTRYLIKAADLMADEAPLSVSKYVLDKAIWNGGKLTFQLSAPHAMRKLKFPSKQILRDEYPGTGEQLLR